MTERPANPGTPEDEIEARQQATRTLLALENARYEQLELVQSAPDDETRTLEQVKLEAIEAELASTKSSYKRRGWL